MTQVHPLFTLIGYAAAVCTTVAFVPQLLRVWQRRTARDISLSMFLVFSIGELFWLLYGIFIHSLPVILANAITLLLALAILTLKLYFDRKPSES